MSKQSGNIPTESDEWGKRKSTKKPRGKWTIEYRLRPKKDRLFSSFTKDWEKWRTYYTKYQTKERRDQALYTLQKKDDYFEYRKPLGERDE